MFDTDLIHAEMDRLAGDPGFIAAVAAIRPGRFDRTSGTPAYAARLTYTRALRRFVCNPAAMNEILQEPALKARFFRLFGYRGALDFTIYPNAWLRDLPLLEIGSGAYLGDGIVLGTNQVSPDQKSLIVKPIRIGARTILDQQCAVGPGTVIGDDCRIGIRCLIGLRCSIGTDVTVNGASEIGHGVQIGEGAVIGYGVGIGNFAVIEPGVELPDRTHLPAGHRATARGIVPRSLRLAA